ncbi:MAG: 6-carboxytetrahydropterin synthase [Spirochaetia bacterium]|nr:6-carboxytetrahydropterin synthase [Spirochaetia bacterium]
MKKKFISRHFLIGGDWGDENTIHSHPYEIELRIKGNILDRHNYLTDLVMVQEILDETVSCYNDRLLNDLPPFADTNPSLEIFSRILAEEISGKLDSASLISIEVRLWENDSAWASWEKTFQ